ncbi:MAG: 16S rRNA (uracil(1498)-N(3))-methyltransferase [Bacteroidota bacterium]|nr:16S rRNA (uracil(1498)-N(3))-methyltransferase [Bacteroidota bacterium]
MSSEYFYVRPDAVHGKELVIDGDEAKHIARVLRKIPGDMIWVVDGAGRAYDTVITAVNQPQRGFQHEVRCEVLHVEERLNEADVDVTLAVALLKHPARMDWIVEKGTELGIRRFVPLRTMRVIGNAAKEERWKSIAIAAMKQSGRSFLPQMYPIMQLEILLEHSSEYDLKMIPYEQTDHVLSIAEAMKHRERLKSVLIVIGPEGGFTDEEIGIAERLGFVQVSLGRQRLRTETAAIVATAITLSNADKS